MKHDIPDKEELTIKRAQDGSLTLRAYVSGHPSRVGFGEDEHVSYLLLDGTSSLQLKDALEPRYGRQSSEDLFWQLVAEKTECIADILDICDAQSIHYTYKSLGSESDCCLREL